MIEKFKSIEELNGEFPDYVLSKVERDYIIIRHSVNPHKRKYCYITQEEYEELLITRSRRHKCSCISEKDLGDRFNDVDDGFLNKHIRLTINLSNEFEKEWYSQLLYITTIEKNSLPKVFIDCEDVDVNECFGVYYEDFNKRRELLCIVSYNKTNGKFFYYDEYFSNVIKIIEGITYKELYEHEIKCSIDRVIEPLLPYRRHYENFIKKINTINDYDSIRTYQDDECLSCTYIIEEGMVKLTTWLHKSSSVDMDILKYYTCARLRESIDRLDDWNF